LERPLPVGVRAAAFKQLLQLRPSHTARLELFARLNDKALAEEVGPAPGGVITWLPGYAIYLVGKKLYQGRDPTFMEWFEAAAEMVPAAKAAKGRKVFTTALKHSGLQLAEKTLGRQAAQQLMKKGMERELIKWSITGQLAQLQRTARRITTLEITRPVQFMFRYSGINRETLRRCTGLEARLFMRKDARVYLHLHKSVLGKLTHRFLNEFAESVADDVLERVDETAAQAVRDVKQVAKVAQTGRQLLESWRRHAAAWWLLNTGSLHNLPGPTKSRHKSGPKS
jgi:hypothetical protein